MPLILDDHEVQERYFANKDHWIIPGGVKAGTCYLFKAADVKSQTVDLVLLELTVAIVSYTNFMGTMSPWLLSDAIVATHDPFSTLTVTKRLSRGRGSDGLTGIKFSCYEFSELVDVVNAETKLCVSVTDKYSKCHPSSVLEAMSKGTTFAMKYADSLQSDLDSGCPYNVISVTEDTATGAIILTSEEGEDIVAASYRDDGHTIVWDKAPPTGVSMIEQRVWKSLHRAGATTANGVARVLGMNTKQQKVIVRDALASLEEAGYVTRSKQTKKVGGKLYNVWST